MAIAEYTQFIGRQGESVETFWKDGYDWNAHFKKKEVEVEGITFVSLEAEEQAAMIHSLGSAVVDSGRKYDMIIGAARGGWEIAPGLSDVLAIKRLDTLQYRRVQNGADLSDGEVVRIGSIPIVEGARVLIAEDLVDKGPTMVAAKKDLLAAGALEVHIATLFRKPWSIIQPEYSLVETTTWVMLRHEIIEKIIELRNQWLKRGIDMKEIRDNFLRIGLNSAQIDYSLNLPMSNGHNGA